MSLIHEVAKHSGNQGVKVLLDAGLVIMNLCMIHFRYSAVSLSRAPAGGKVSRDAGPVKGGTTHIAFVDDPTGYKWELIQRSGPIPEPIAQAHSLLSVRQPWLAVAFERMVDSKGASSSSALSSSQSSPLRCIPCSSGCTPRLGQRFRAP